MLLHLITILTSCVLVDVHYVLYYTEFNQTFDCLYAYIIADDNNDDVTRIRNYHLTPYCRRLDDNEEENSIFNIQDRSNMKQITFEELNARNVTSEQLLLWSAPIDIAERYEMNSTTQEVFYNCSAPWFGSYCQYKFPYGQFPSFGDIVQANFERRGAKDFSPNNGTCYRFLTNCNDKPWPFCLDWREICDGKPDCRNAEDEKLCEQLDLSQCADDEYRCHFGGQCIPRIFLRDNPQSIDCLDGSDEKEDYFFHTASYNLYCLTLSTFSCEERTGRYPRNFPCGNGIYHDEILLPSFRIPCYNFRDRQMSKLLLTSLDHISEMKCQEAFYCALHYQRDFGKVDKII